jgi:hypothetical protein
VSTGPAPLALPTLPVAGEQGPIPATLHQFWLGSPPPTWAQVAWGRWDDWLSMHHPDWSIRYWTNETIVGTPLERMMTSLVAVPGIGWRGVSDYLRVAALALYGGIYADSDTLPTGLLGSLVGERSAWLGGGDASIGHISNALMGFPPGHPFISELWRVGIANAERGARTDFSRIGPHVVAKVYRQRADRWGVVLEPLVGNRPHQSWARATFASEPPSAETVLARLPGQLIVHTSGDKDETGADPLTRGRDRTMAERKAERDALRVKVRTP